MALDPLEVTLIEIQTVNEQLKNRKYFIASIPKFRESLPSQEWINEVERLRAGATPAQTHKVLVDNFEDFMGSTKTRAWALTIRAYRLERIALISFAGALPAGMITAQTAWEHIRDRFLNHFTVESLQRSIKDEVSKIKCESISQSFEYIERMRETLAPLGLQENKVILKILKGLPSNLREKFVALPISLDALRNQVHTYLKLNIESITETSSQNDKSSNSHTLVNDSTEDAQLSDLELFHKMRKNLICDYCGYKGHIISDCRTKVRDEMTESLIYYQQHSEEFLFGPE